MSFWDTLGEIAKVAPTIGAFDAARVAMNTDDPQGGPDGAKENAKQFASAFFKNSGPVGNVRAVGKVLTSQPVTTAMEPLVWTANQASHGFSAVRAMGGMLEDSGQTGIDNLWSGDLWDGENWRKAWDASDGISGGEALLGQQAADLTGGQEARWWSTQAEREKFDEQRSRTGFRVGAGALDIMLTWYADPTIAVGKAAKVARTASRIVDAEQANRVGDILASKLDTAAQSGDALKGRSAAEKAKGLFSTGDEEIANRLWDNVAKTDNMDFDQVANHFAENLRRTGDAGPIVGILGQAGRIKDVQIQRQVKADALLTAAGSTAARDRLIQNAPEIARAIERVTQPPEAFQIVDDLVKEGVSGKGLLDAATRWASPGNKKELEAYASTLDDIHTRIAATKAVGDRGGLENIGSSVLGTVKSKYRAGMAQEFFFQPGPHARTVRVLHWATGQRMRGVIATDDAMRGHDELMDTLTRSGLFSADERKAYSSSWWAAPTQADRTHLAQHLPEAILNKLAAKHFDGDRKMMDHVISTYKGWADSARTYTTKQMEEAVANGATRVVLEDPLTGIPTSIDKALFETHIANNVGIPDVATLERLVRHAKQGGSLGDKALKSSEWALKTAEDANDLWRTLTLARPGFVLRTQLDTQMRSTLAVGAASVLTNAMKGLGHKVGDVLNGEEVGKVSALASDMLRQETLRTEASALRQRAGTLSGEAGQRLLDRAAQLEDEAGKVVTYDATKRRLVTQDRTLDIKGQKVTTRAAASDREAEGITAAVHTGDMTLGDAITQLGGQYNLRFAQDAKNWVTTMPDDIEWAASWLRSKDALVNSKAGRAILEVMDEPAIDMVGHLRRNADVRAAWKNVADQNPHFETWLERAIGQAEWTAPTRQVRDALRSGKVLKPEDVDTLFKPANAGADEAVGLAERMPVHAPAMDLIDPTKSGIESLTGLARKLVGIMSDAPDTVLGRMPFYTEKYFSHFRELAAREIDRTGELGLEARARIEKVARHRAIQDTRETMYDTARFTGAHDRVARMGFAFLGAWEDSMRAYGRLFYDDPARIGKVAKIWTMPERGGFVVDEKGLPVRPGQDAREKWLTVPVSWMPGVGFKDFKIRKDSLNVIWQGDVPWFPGFAPGVQVPVTQIAARAFPEVADPNFKIGDVKVGESALFRAMFGFGLPKTGVGVGAEATSAVDQFTPGWVKRLRDVFTGDSEQFNDAYSMALNTEIMKARDAGKDPNSKAVIEAADAKARRTARSMMFMEFVSNFGLGLSGEGSTEADFYRQRYREISAREAELTAQGTTVKDEFLRQFPQAAGLKWSFSENETGINATLNVENRIKKYGKDIQKNPEFGWFYVGSDNVGGEFSQASYAAQFGREATPGSGQAWRSKQNRAEIRQGTAASLGWDQYYKVKDEIDSELAARGLHSLQQKGAEDLNTVMKTFRSDLMAENPDWAKDYNSFDAEKMQSFLTQVAEPAMKDQRLKNRSDIKMMADYLALRDEAIQIAESRGTGLGSRQAYDLRQVLLQTGAQMAQENIGFSQMWQRVLSREIDLAADQFPDAGQDTTQQASALGTSIFK